MTDMTVVSMPAYAIRMIREKAGMLPVRHVPAMHRPKTPHCVRTERRQG